MNGCIYRTEHDVCKKYTTDKATSFCVGRNCLDRKESNSDRLRRMTDEELAEWYFDKFFPCAPYCSTLQDECPEHDDCKICLLEWLKRESECE